MNENENSSRGKYTNENEKKNGFKMSSIREFSAIAKKFSIVNFYWQTIFILYPITLMKCCINLTLHLINLFVYVYIWRKIPLLSFGYDLMNVFRSDWAGNSSEVE